MLFEILDELDTFINLVKLNSSYELTKKKNMNISTIWRHVTIVENYLNLKLIFRDSTSGIELTKDGLQVYNALYLNQLKLQNHSQDTEKQSLVIYILTTVLLAKSLAKENLKSIINSDINYEIRFITFTSTTFQIYFNLPHNNLLEHFIRGCDIMLINNASLESQLNCSEWEHAILKKNKSHLFCTNQYIDSSPYKLSTPSDLIHHSYIGDYAQNKLNLISNNKAINVEINSRYMTNSIYLKMVMASQNLGITHIPENFTKAYNKDITKNLIKVLPKYYSSQKYLKLFKNKNRPPKTNLAINHFINNIFGEINW